MDSDYYSLTQNTDTGSQSRSSETPRHGLAGTIISIHMKNFMCHENCEVKLEPRINFITGKNGSGKSAIQTAIAVGLGGKALATNRGTSIKALIMNGKSSCSITIVMSNEGPLAYKPTEYGSMIQVDRFFSHSSGGYKIKNASGKIVSTEKKELDKIVAQFNIQTDNPVCILHQDVARNFLNSTDPKKKFIFYLKASRFDEITALYINSTLRIHAIKDVIASKFETASEAFKDVLELKKKIEIMEDAKQKEKLRVELENELVWANIHEDNVKLEELQKKKEIEILAKKKIEIKLKDTDEGNLKAKMKESEEKIKAIDSSVEDARNRLRPAKDEYNKKKEEIGKLGAEYNEVSKSVRRTKQKLESCLSELQNLTRNAPELKLRQEKLKKNISDCENNLAQVKSAEEMFQHEKQQLQDTIDNYNREMRQIRQRTQEKQRLKNKIGEQIKQMERNSSNVAVYGQIMERIVSEVNRAAQNGKFTKKPIGPIGLYIKVKDPQWAGAVENFLGKGFLSSFCVDNFKDAQTLNGLMRGLCQGNSSSQPSVICSKFFPQVHNVAASETGTRKLMSLFRALETSNPVVANCLIDQKEVETILLIPTNDEAYQILDEVHKVPRNCKRAFTLTGDLFHPAPNYKSYSSPRTISHATFLQANQEDVIRQLKNEIKDLNAEIENISGEESAIHEQNRGTLESLVKNDTELKTLKNQRNKLIQNIAEMKNSIEPENDGTQIGYFVDESKELEKTVQEETRKKEELKTRLEKLQAKSDEAKEKFNVLQNTISEADKEKAPILGEIQRLKSTIQQKANQADLIKHRLEEHNNKLTQIETEVTELTEQINQNSENASQICCKVNTRRKPADVNRQLKGVVLYLKKLEEENGGTFSELQKNYSERQANFDTVMGDLSSLRNLVMRTLQSLKMRRKKERLLQACLANSAKHNFQSYLNERNFDGKLEFDMDEEKLEIKVKPMKGKGASVHCGGKTDTSSLSGGEKSFASICFIIALWQEVELPFRFLDEFDVFMDGINRRATMDLLIWYAKNVNQQFVFLTPLDTSSIPLSDIVTVHRLEAPRK